MRLTSNIQGLTKTQKKLRKYHALSRIRGRELVKRAAKNGVRFAKRKVPVGATGKLKQSIGARFKDGGLSYEIFAAQPYAIYAEFQKRGADGEDRPEDRRLWLTRTFKRQNQFLRRQLRKMVRLINQDMLGGGI